MVNKIADGNENNGGGRGVIRISVELRVTMRSQPCRE